MSDPSTPEPMVKWSEQWWATRSPQVQGRRCHAHRKNGQQCKRVSCEAQRVCPQHGGRAPQAKQAARRRIEEASLTLAKELLKMAVADDVSDAVKLSAIKDGLDRAGLGAPRHVDVEVAVKPYELILESVSAIETGSRADYRRSRGIADDSEPPALADRPTPDDDGIVTAEILDDGAELLRRMRAYRPEDHDDDPMTCDDPDIVSTAHLAGIPTPPGSGLLPIEEAAEIAADMRMRAARMHPTRPPQWALGPGNSGR